MIFLLLTKQLPRTECGLRVTRDANLACQIKKGHAERMWQNGVQRQRTRVPWFRIACSLSGPREGPSSHSRGECWILFWKLKPNGELIWFAIWSVNGFAFSVPIFLSIWLEGMRVCNKCLHPWPLYFHLFIWAIWFHLKKNVAIICQTCQGNSH